MTNEGSKIDPIASQFGFHQLINKLTHLTRNTPSCLDVIFTSQPNLILKSGIHFSFHENFHNNFCKMQSKNYYLLLHGQEVWQYQKVNIGNIGKVNKCISVGSTFCKYFMFTRKLICLTKLLNT